MNASETKPDLQPRSALPPRRLSVAPMLDWTDRHCRNFHRLLAPHAWLYTEMVTTGALLHGDVPRHLRFDPDEHPVALQLGGSEPDDLARCAKLAEEWGYDEVNLNCGCPSERVQKGAFGACLMNEPGLVADCVRAMREATRLPVTVKHRIGIDKIEHYDFVQSFVTRVSEAGCSTFIVHARNAWLKGLSPKENREIPPLRYEVAYQLKQEFPQLEILINGGIETSDAVAEHLRHVDGVMIGREAYHNPWALVDWERICYDEDWQPARDAIIEGLVAYAGKELEAHGTPVRAIARHVLGFANGMPGARRFRQMLSDPKELREAAPELFARAWSVVTDAMNAARENENQQFAVCRRTSVAPTIRPANSCNPPLVPEKNVMAHELHIFSGNSNRSLATEICSRLGLELSPLEISRFSNDNLHVQIQTNVRERDVFVIQSFTEPVSDHIMELLITIDALRSASARRVTAVIPYYSYARSDKKDAPRISITGRLIADMLKTAGADRVLTMDLHADQVHGFFSIPVDHLTAIPTIAEHFRNKHDLDNMVAVATDAGGAKRVGRFSERLGIPMAIIDKRRVSDTRVKQGHVIGDVKDRDCVIFEDEISTAGTLVSTVETLKNAGARTIHAGAVHGVLCGPAIERLQNSGIESIVVTNTVDMPPAKKIDKITQLSIAPILAAAIERIHSGASVGALFE